MSRSFPLLFRCSAFAIVCGCAPVLAQAQGGYPSKPVRVIVATAAASGADLVARIVLPKLGETLGRPFVIENRPGAGGSIATEMVARSSADGYTLLFGVAGLTITQALYKKLSYSLEQDLAPVGLVGAAPLMLVIHPSLPVKNVKELIAFAKARPAQVLYGSSGNGSSPHLTAELFGMRAGVRLVHVPYKGSPQSVSDLIAGQVALMFAAPSTFMPHVLAGRLRALAVSSDRRSVAAPNVPTMVEAGMPDFKAGTWNGLLAPAGTPQDVVTRLNGEILKATQLPEIRERLAALGMDPVTGSPTEFAALISTEVANWRKVIAATSARVD